MKNYIGIVRDHSGSMTRLAKSACDDFNHQVSALKESTKEIDKIVSVVKCGSGYNSEVRVDVSNSSVAFIKKLEPEDYDTEGRFTPLWDSVGSIIDILNNVPDKDNIDVTFLVIVITDGLDNSSSKFNKFSIASKINRLQISDKWTFVFRVPVGMRKRFSSLGIPIGNIQEWNQDVNSLKLASMETSSAIGSYYETLSKGIARSSTSFYTNLSYLKDEDVKKKLENIFHKIQIIPVHTKTDIKSFMKESVGKFVIGTGYYELTKTEDVQESKNILIIDENTGYAYSGRGARDIIGIPSKGTIKLKPGNNGHWRVFIQSLSNNRVLLPQTSIIYIPN